MTRRDPLEAMTEKEWQSQVVDLARMLGWRLYHTHDSRRSQPGFPDLVLVRDRVVFVELKTEKGKLSDPQRQWLTALRDAGSEAWVARPSQLQDLADALTSDSYSSLDISTYSDLLIAKKAA